MLIKNSLKIEQECRENKKGYIFEEIVLTNE